MTAPESTQELSPHASNDESAVPDEAAPARGARRLRWLVWLVAGVVLVGVAGVAWWVGSSAQSPDQAAARAVGAGGVVGDGTGEVRGVVGNGDPAW